MTPLTKRQELALALAEKIAKLGGIVTSPLPLKAETPLRFSVAQDGQSALLSRLQTWGWGIVCCGVETRFITAGNNYLPQDMSVFELRIPPDKVAEPTKSAA